MKLGPRQERYVGNKYKAGDLETVELHFVWSIVHTVTCHILSQTVQYQ